MKKVFCMLMMVSIMFTTLTIMPSAASVPTITLEQVEKCVEDFVEIKINLKNNPGIVGANLKVSFSNNLKLVGATNGTVFSTLTYIPPKGLTGGAEITSDTNFIWSGFDIEDSDIKNGTILLLKFRVVKGLNSKYQVSVTSEKGDVIDRNMKPLVLSANKTIAANYHKSDTIVKNEKTATEAADGYTGDIYCKTCGELLSKGETVYKIKKVSLSVTAYRYNGEVNTPSVIATDIKNKKLTLNTDFSVLWPTSPKNVGTYKVTVTFIGRYSGTKTLNFTIYKNLSAPGKVTAVLYGSDDVKISWSKVTDAKAYKLYYKKVSDKEYTYKGQTAKTSMKVANLNAGVKYDFKVVPCTYENSQYYEDDSFKTTSIYTIKSPSSLKLAKSGAGKLKVSWAAVKGTSGYEISVSASRTKAGTIHHVTANSKIIAVKKNKTYYYKVRTYKTEKGKRIYSDWSKVKGYKLK